MADIVNAGAILLVAAFGFVAVVAGADQIRENSGPASSLGGSDDASGAGRSDASDVDTPILGKPDLGDNRDDKGRNGDGERNRDPHGKHGAKDDEDRDEEDDEDEEDDD